jgi:hypothetical protein
VFARRGRLVLTHFVEMMQKMCGTRSHAYEQAQNPSPHTNLLARFSLLPTLPAGAPPELIAFAQARCEVRMDEVPAPLRLCLADGVLAALGCGGWKQRDPTVLLYRIDEGAHSGLGTSFSVDVGLGDLAHHLRLDTTRQCVYVADEERVKSYRWTFGANRRRSKAVPVHTLDTDDFEGGMALLDSGARLLRFGSGGMGVWAIDDVPTHGEDGKDIVGEEMDVENLDSWRDNDDGDKVELSEGALPTTIVDVESLRNIEICEAHPFAPAQLLVTYEEVYPPALVDVETQQSVLRFVGHGGAVDCIATSAADPHAFVTAARDGGVRMYDTRAPAPALAIKHTEEFLHAALYEHVGGQPCASWGRIVGVQCR